MRTYRFLGARKSGPDLGGLSGNNLLIGKCLRGGSFAFVKSTQMQSLIRKEQTTLTETIHKELAKNTNTAVTSELYKQFLQPFITAYINIPTEQQAFFL